MENSLTLALARQTVLARQMDVIATNLANANTSAYKAEEMIFQEFLEQTETGEILSLVHDVSFMRDVSEGPLVRTGGSLDVAIHGDGFLRVQTPEGERYSRHGVLQLDTEGQLVTTLGHPVLGTGGTPILVPPDAGDIAIARDGTVSADNQAVGQLDLVAFEDERALKKLGESLYDALEQVPQAAEGAEVLQGMVEQSNVQAVTEITRMIDTQRAYQAAAKLADSEHQRILDAIQALVDTSA